MEAQHAAIIKPMPTSLLKWLKDLSESSNPSLSAWAAARRLEAGDYSAFPTYEKRMFDHIYGISKPGSGRADAVVEDPPMLARAQTVERDSPFWGLFFHRIDKELDSPLDPGLYSIWCYGTRFEQRPEILKTASHVMTKVTVKNPNPDPWNDPRFWIVVDWALAWGKETDFQAIEKTLPEGLPRSEFSKIHRCVGELPTFWGFTLPPPKGKTTATPQSPDGEANSRVKSTDFQQLKVKIQPTAPSYPSEARARRMMSVIVLSITVDEDGVPLGAKLLPGPWLAFFGPTAYEYGMKWRFEPALLNGAPQIARFNLTMPFHLE